MADVFWTSTTNGDWTAGANWNTGAPPGPADDAVLGIVGFAISQNYTVSVTSSVSAGVLTISNSGAELSVSAPGTLAVAGDGTNSGDVELQFGGAIDIGGDFTNSGTVNVDTQGSFNNNEGGSSFVIGGTLTNSNTINIGRGDIATPVAVSAAALANTSTINITGNYAVGTTQQAVLDIAAAAPTAWAGTVSLSGQGSLAFGAGSIQSIAQSGEIAINTSDGYLEDAGAPGSNSALTGLASNAGELVLEYGAILALSGALSNSGTIYLDNDTGFGSDPAGGSALSMAGVLTNSGTINIGNSILPASTVVTATGLANTGTINLNGNTAAGSTDEAVLDIAAAAPTTWTGTVELNGASLLEYSSGFITATAAGSVINVSSPDGYIADAGALTSDSALTQLATNAGTFGLQYGAAATLTGSLTNTGAVDIDTTSDYGDAPSGGSALTIAGALINSGTFAVGNSFFGDNQLTATSVNSAGSLDNTGSIYLTGNNSATGTKEQAQLLIAAAAPAAWVGYVQLSGQSLLQFGGGSITSIVAGAEIDIATPDGYIADAGATTTSSALTGLASNAGTFALDYGAVVSLAGGLTNTGAVDIDTANNYGDTVTGNSVLAIAGTLTNSSTVNIGSAFLGSGQITSDSTVTAAALANTGTLTLIGSGTVGTTARAILDIAAAAPATWIGTLSLNGQAILEYGSGQIQTIAQGSQIYLGSIDGYLADAGATTSNSALTGLTTNAGDFELQYGATVSLAGTLTNSGSLEVDTQTNYNDTPSGGSSLTIAGTLVNSGSLDVGGSFLGTNPLTATSTVTAAALTNTGGLYLFGNNSAGSANQAVIDIAGAAPTLWTGTAFLTGNSLLEFGSGEITGIAAGGQIDLSTPNGTIADAGALATNSALTGLGSNAGDFELQYGASVMLAGGLTSTGMINVDNHGRAFDGAPGGSALTIAGTLTNSGAVGLGNGSLAAATTVTAAALNNQAAGTISAVGGSMADLTVTIAGAAVNAGSITFSNGVSATVDSLTNTGTLSLNGNSGVPTSLSVLGAASIAGTATVGAFAEMGVTGALTDAGTLNLGGTVDVASGFEVTGTGSLVLQGGQIISPSGAGLTVDPGGAVSGDGTVSVAIVNDGTVTASGGVLDLADAVTGSGTLAIGAGGALELGGSDAQTVGLGGNVGTLELNAPASFTGAITGLVAGDTIDLVGLQATSAVVNGSTLTVTAGSQVLNYQISGPAVGTTVLEMEKNAQGTNLVFGPPGPVIEAPSSQGAFLGFPTLLGPLTISDLTAGNTSLTVTITSVTGLLFGTAANAGSLTGSNSNQLVLTGDLADINAMLASVAYGGIAAGMTDTVQVEAVDASNQSAVQTITVTTDAVPFTEEVVNFPSQEYVLSNVNSGLNGISVSDPSAQETGQPVPVTFASSTGSLTVTGAAGATIAGQGTDNVTISGTVSQLNGDLSDGLELYGYYAFGLSNVSLGVKALGALIAAVETNNQTGDAGAALNAAYQALIKPPGPENFVAALAGSEGAYFIFGVQAASYALNLIVSNVPGNPPAKVGGVLTAALKLVLLYAKGAHVSAPGGSTYNLDAAGDFVLAQSTLPGDSLLVQVQMQPVDGSSSISAATKVGAQIGSDAVTFGLDRSAVVWVDGAPSALSMSHPITLSGGSLSQNSTNVYQLVYDTGEIVTVTDDSSYLDVSVTPSPAEAAGSIVGLGNTNGALQLPDGTQLAQPVTAAELTQFETAWQVTPATSLLNDGSGPIPTFDPNFPQTPLTLADFPTAVVAQAAHAVAAAGITDPGSAAVAELDYIVNGGDMTVVEDDASQLQGVSVTPTTVSGLTVPVALGVLPSALSVGAVPNGPTPVTFDLYLTAPAATDTVVDYAVTATEASDLVAAAFGGSFPSGSVTIAAGATSGQFTIDVPQGAVGSSPDDHLAIQISSPTGAAILASTARQAITQPAAGPPAVPEIVYLGAFGTFAQSGNNYTLDLGDVTLGEVLPELQFGIANVATAPADELTGTFQVAPVIGFQATGDSIPLPIEAGSTYRGLTLDINQAKFGANGETITFDPVDTNASGYSASLAPLTLTISDNLQVPGDITSEAYGDVHILTYNGTVYNFQAAGQFILAESTTPGDSFDIQLRLQPVDTSASVTYITQVAISVGADDITFSTGALDGATVLLVDGATPALSMAKPVLTLSGGTITEVSPTLYKVAWNTGESATITEQYSIYSQLDFFQVTDTLPYAAAGTVMGLQGENEGTANDFQLPDGTVLQQPLSSATLLGQYADAWRVTPTNSLFTYLPGQSFANFAHPDFPTQQITLADLPANVVAAAAALVAAAGITDPAQAAAAELDYIATGDPSIITADADVQQQVTGTVAPAVTPSTTPAAALGVEATQTSVVEAASGATQVTFTVYLTAAETTATVVDYTLGTMAGDLSAAAFGGTLPAGAVTIAAGQTTAQITIDVPQGALGTLPNAAVAVQIASPGGAVPIFAPTAQTQIVNTAPEPGAAPDPILSYLGTGGTFTFNAATNTYTLNLGSVSQGSALFAAEFGVTNASTGVADLLGGSFSYPTGSGFTITGNELPNPLGDGQIYDGLYASVDTATLGSNTITLTFNPLDENASGYSAALAPITLDIVDSVTPPATVAFNTPSTVIFPNVHVGATDSQVVSVTNTAAAGAASLDVTLTPSGQATASGAVTQLAPGKTDATDLSVGIDTASAGALAGSVTENTESVGTAGTSSIDPEYPYIDVFGDVYRLATAELTPPAIAVALGASGHQTITISNTDPNDGYSENLIATVVGTTGAVTASGTTGDIAAQASGTLAVSFATTTAGPVGTVTLDLQSDGTGIDGLGITNLGDVTVPVTVQAVSAASPQLVSSNGTLTQTTPGNDTLNLGTVTQGGAATTVSLAVLNAATAPADTLGGSFTVTGGSNFTNTGFAAFSGVAAGAQAGGDTIAINTATIGIFTETIVLTPTDSNGVALNPLTLTVEGTVAAASVPGPTVSSPSLTVAENAAATAIGITASEDPSFATPVTATIGTLPTDGTVALASGAAVTAGETLTAAQLAGLIFTPATGDAAVSSTLTYTVTDPAANTASGTATLAIGPAIVNAAPPTVSSPSLTVAENAAATAIGIVATEAASFTTPLTATLGALPTDGTVALANGTAVTAGETLTAAQLAGLTFTPTTGDAAVSSTLTYTVTDPSGNTASGAATLAIGPAIVKVALPTVSSPSLTVAENAAATAIGIVATEASLFTTGLTATLGTLPTDGTVALASGTSVTAGETLTAAQLAGLTFTPTPGASSETSTLAYTVTDPSGNTASGSASLTIAAATSAPATPTIAFTPPQGGAASPLAITNDPTPIVAGSAAAGASLVFDDPSAVGSGAAAAAGTYSATLSSALGLGLTQVTTTATSGGTALTSTAASVFEIPTPVAGISTADDSSLDIGKLFAAGYTLQFVSGTEAAVLVDGTLSVGPDTNEAYLQRLYEGLLGRSNDPSGIQYWDDSLTGGASATSIASGFLSSAEFQADHPAATIATDSQFVTLLYQDLLGRAPTAGDTAYWTGVSAQYGRAAIVADIAESTESKSVLAADTTEVWARNTDGTVVNELYEAGLGREVELSGLAFWKNTLQTGALTPLTLAQTIMGEPEFVALHGGQSNAAYVTSLYQADFGRVPDVAGGAFWTNALNAGTLTRAGVLLGIATSAEGAADQTRTL